MQNISERNSDHFNFYLQVVKLLYLFIVIQESYFTFYYNHFLIAISFDQGFDLFIHQDLNLFLRLTFIYRLLNHEMILASFVVQLFIKNYFVE